MAKKKNVPQVRFAGYSDEWVKYQFGDILDKYEDPVATPHNGYERLGVRSHVKGTFHSYVAPGSELETAQMHRVAADKLLFNITFAWEHAVAITDETDAGKLVSHRFPQFTFVPGMEPKFFRYVVADDKFRYHLWLSSPGGAGRNRVLNIPEMLEYQTYLPQKAEQIQLADWFSNLDVMIVQHQSKLEKLRNIKSSMLEKMFPRNGSCYPEIRFKGFTDPWEQRKLEDYLSVSNEKNTSDVYGRADVLSVSGDFGIVNQIEFQGRSFAGASVSNYGVVQTGDVVYTKSPLNSNPYGIIKTNKGKAGIVSTLYAVYHPRETVFPDFVQVYFEQHARMNNYMHPLVNKGAKNDMKVSAENALKGPVCFPSYAEQRTISAFFSVLDHLIILHQRELGKLQSIKKALLEKMFV